MRARAFRRGLVLLICAAALSGCSSVAKQNYIRHLSTTIAPDRRETAVVTSETPDPGVVAVTAPNSPRP